MNLAADGARLAALALGLASTTACLAPNYQNPGCVIDGTCPAGLTCESGLCIATPLCDPADPDLMVCMTFNDGLAVNAGQGPQPDLARGFPQDGSTPGVVGAAARFDGTTIVHFGEDPRLDLASFTIEAFVRLDQVPAIEQRVGLVDNDFQFGAMLQAPECPDDGVYLACTIAGEALCFALAPPPGSAETLAAFAARWHHVACVYQGEGSTLTLYFDGARVGTRQTAPVPTDAMNGVTLGQDGRADLTGTIEPLIGALDELRIWRTARSDAQLQAAAAREL